MTINYLQNQKHQIDLQRLTEPQEANARLDDLKLTLEAYIKLYGLPEMWAEQLRKELE